MIVQVDPSRTVQSDPRQQDCTRNCESSQDRNQARHGGGDDEGQSNTIERSVHNARLGDPDE